MQDQGARIRTIEQNGVTVAEFMGPDILDEIHIAQMGEQLTDQITRQQPPRLVLDFTHVAHMSSAALGMLITLLKRVRERQGHLRLCCIRPQIYEVFVITKLNGIFEIYDDRSAAVASIP